MATPTAVNTTVFSLAGGGFRTPPVQPAATFSDPVPLGVRFFSIVDAGERWVTRWVDDIQFRSVVPGGFASATITLRIPRGTGTIPHPDQLGFSRMVELFTRVQVVDLRTLEVAWEGRVEDPARQVEPDTWQIGALGSMVAATDVQRPVFYVDSSVDNWQTGWVIWTDGTFHYSSLFENWSTSKDTAKRWLVTTIAPGYTFAPPINPGTNDPNNAEYAWRWDSHGYDQSIARITTTHDGIGDTGTATAAVVVGIAENWKIDITTFTSTEQTKSNKIGTDFTDTNTRYVVIGITSYSGSYSVTDADHTQVIVKNPVIVAMRQDRFGNKLTASTSYGSNAVTVAQVVEDVLGRFLVGGWFEGGANTPLPGSVRPTDAYIDTSDTTQILQLTYPDGATAADILGDLINQVSPNAYWAIWESAWKAGTPSTATSGYRFEWSQWPANWGYLATSQDGWEGQPNGDDVYNFVFYRFPDTDDSNQVHCTTSWLNDDMAPELYTGGFTRAITVNKTDPTSEANSGTLVNNFLNTKRKVKNAGTLTIRRPIQLYDAGTNSNSGAGRMVDPWMIRPGKLIRIADLPPRAGGTDMSYGDTAPNSALDGTIFKVVATDYSSADNSCRLSLDQVTNWQIPTQITKSGGGTKTIRIQ
jgi:hypothetical protein